MKFVRLLVGVVAAATIALPSVAAAQALDAETGRQAVLDLANEVRGSAAVYLVGGHQPMGRDACTAYDPAAQEQAAIQLNDFDQRATDLANRTSGGIHAQAMTLVRAIESTYWELYHPVVPDRCYVAPGA